jgi:hypothetical protein
VGWTGVLVGVKEGVMRVAVREGFGDGVRVGVRVGAEATVEVTGYFRVGIRVAVRVGVLINPTICSGIRQLMNKRKSVVRTKRRYWVDDSRIELVLPMTSSISGSLVEKRSSNIGNLLEESALYNNIMTSKRRN